MKCQILFSGKKKEEKYISMSFAENVNPSLAEPGHTLHLQTV